MGSYLGIHEVIEGRCDSDAGERRLQCLSVLTMGLPGKSHSYTFESTIPQVQRLHFWDFPGGPLYFHCRGHGFYPWSGN